MGKSKFTETQIVNMLKYGRCRSSRQRDLAEARHQFRYLLQVEIQVRRTGGLRCKATEGTSNTKTPVSSVCMPTCR